MRRLAFDGISQAETKSAKSRKRGEREKERKKEKIMPSLMATSLGWRTHSARTKIPKVVAYLNCSLVACTLLRPKKQL